MDRPAQATASDPHAAERASPRLRMLSALRLKDDEAFAKLIETGSPWTGAGNEDYGKSRTPLMWAASVEWPEAIKALVASGSPIDERSSQGSTALLLALEECLPSVATLLLDLGASMDAADSHGSSAMHAAAACQGSERIHLLLDRGFRSDALDNLGYTAMGVAAMNENHEAIHALVNAGYDIDRNGGGGTVLALSTHFGVTSMAATLLSLGADVDTEDVHGDTPLSIAILGDRADIASMLFDAGADPRRTSSKGVCALNPPPHCTIGSETLGLARRRAEILNSRDAIVAAVPPREAGSPRRTSAL